MKDTFCETRGCCYSRAINQPRTKEGQRFCTICRKPEPIWPVPEDPLLKEVREKGT